MLLLTRHNGLGRTDAAGLGEVGLDRDEVVGRLEAGPQPDNSATAASSALAAPVHFVGSSSEIDGRPCSDCWDLQGLGLQSADPEKPAC